MYRLPTVTFCNILIRYGNRPFDDACRYNFQRGIGLLRGSSSGAAENASDKHADAPPNSAAAPTASHTADSARPQPDATAAKLSPRAPAPVAHSEVSVAIGESSDLVAAALEDMQSQGSKAKFLLPSLLCSAVSSGDAGISSPSHRA